MERRKFFQLFSGVAVSALPGIRQAAAAPRRVGIVGGGILGGSLAYHLARRGAQVTVFEKTRPAAGATANSFAWINATFSKRPHHYHHLNRLGALGYRHLERELGGDLVSLHAGFLPHDPADPERPKLISRLHELDEAFKGEGIRLAFETGQEDAETLLAVLEELGSDNIGVNFDPANMILYAMGDPVESFERLAEHVMQVHIKDATKTETPGTWGAEVPVGTGEVDWDGFFGVMNAKGIDVGMMIEREAGDDRVEDIRIARSLVDEKMGAQA